MHADWALKGQIKEQLKQLRNISCILKQFISRTNLLYSNDLWITQILPYIAD